MKIKFNNVSFSYGRLSNEKTPSLNDVNLELSAGEMISLIGSNGAGKTTLLNLIGGLTKPSSGSITRTDLNGVSFINQLEAEATWMPITVGEILKMSSYRRRRYFKRITKNDMELIERAAERLEISDLWGTQFNSLSRGQRQRVRMSLAISQEPDLLVMDEPLNGLDILSQERIQKVIQEEKLRGAAIATATHSLDEARQADRVLLLDGRVVAQGTPAETLTEENLRTVYKDRLERTAENKFIVVDHH